MSTSAQRKSANDEILLATAALGDRAAFDTFVRRHTGRCMAVALRIIGDRCDAEEIVQDAFLRLWQHAAQWRPEEARPTTWLHRIVVNRAIDHARRRNGVTIPLDEAADRPDPAPGAEAVAATHELETRATEAILHLPPRQRAALWLSSVGAMDCAAAAGRLHVSVSAMESLLVRGRRALRDELRPLGLEPELRRAAQGRETASTG